MSAYQLENDMNRKARQFIKRNDDVLCALLALVAAAMFLVPAIIVIGLS
jgi:lipopolysaccharide/colanic/teichoic acid biosynthesis glycosyltransferase